MLITKARIIWLLKSSLLVCSVFLLCAALGMLINPDAFHKFFSPVQLVADLIPPSRSRSYYWDVKAYAEMVLNNSCLAFYPLWPMLIRFLFHPQTIDEAAHSLLVVSTVIFFISIPLLVWVFDQAFSNRSLALLLVIAFTLNPMSIFRVIGYTESFFTTLSLLFICVYLAQTILVEKNQLILIFVLTFLMSLTRPILLPFVFASLATLGTILFWASLKLETINWRSFLAQIQQYSREIKLTFTISIAALLGYSVYGFFCWRWRGNFFAPFTDQKLWGTKLGLHLELLLLPKSPLIDLLGLYFPLLVLFIALILLYWKITNQSPLLWIPKSPLWNFLFLYPPLLIVVNIVNFLRLKNKPAEVAGSLTRLSVADYTETLSRNYLFWFSVYFAVAHSAMIFFTRDRLASLGRYIFGVPFFFLALGYLCCCIPGKKTYQALWGLILIGAIALVEQWVNYGYNKWLG
jgi:hypothetical protein